MKETRKFRCDKSKEDILKIVVAHFEKAVEESSKTDMDVDARLVAACEYDALWKLMRDLKVYEEQ